MNRRKAGDLAQEECVSTEPKQDSDPACLRRGRPKRMSDPMQAASIVEKARALFMQKGYGHTTTDDIAAFCHVSKQTLYRLFQSKPELFAAIVEQHRHSMLDLRSDYDELPLQEALEKIFRINLDDADDSERLGLIRFVICEANDYPELVAIMKQRGGDTSRADLARWLARQHAAGRIDIDNAALTAGVLIDMMFGTAIVKSKGHVSFPEGTDRVSHIRRCIRIFLGGVVPR